MTWHSFAYLFTFITGIVMLWDCAKEKLTLQSIIAFITSLLLIGIGAYALLTFGIH